MRWLVSFTLAGLLSACASVSVKEGSHSPVSVLDTKPDRIYVRHFDVDLSSFRVDREGEELRQFKQTTTTVMSQALVERISKTLVPAIALDDTAPLPSGNCWLLEGRFVRVNQGSRALRMFIGFGAGGTKMETSVEVFDLSSGGILPLATFDTTGGSGASPGAITSGPGISGAISAGLTLAGNATMGITDDTERTSRMITAYLTELFHQRGWISDDQLQKAKRISFPDFDNSDESSLEAPTTHRLR